jgi:hypothetical protein
MALFDNKTPAIESPTASFRDEDFQRIDPESGVKRGLKTRHLSMMALAGIIGPGILVGTGDRIRYHWYRSLECHTVPRRDDNPVSHRRRFRHSF